MRISIFIIALMLSSSALPGVAQEKATDTYYIGGVPSAGAYALQGNKVNLLQALVASRFDLEANQDRTVQLIRRDKSGKETVQKFKVDDILNKRNDPKADTMIEADDVIIVRGAVGIAAPAKRAERVRAGPGPEMLMRTGGAQQFVKDVTQRGDKELRQKTLERMLADLQPGKAAGDVATALVVLPAVKDVPFDRAPFLEAVRPLLKHDDGSVRALAPVAIAVLGGGPEDVPAIAALASDKSPVVRARVAGSLYAVAGERPGDAVFAAVDKLLNDDDPSVQLGTIHGLWGRPVSPTSEAKLIEISRGSTEGGPGALAYDAVYYALSTRPSVSPAVATRLIELMRGEGDRGRAMWGLTHHGISPDARAMVTKALLEELDETVNPGERGDLIFGLAALGGDNVVVKLREVAEKDENEKTRKDAADALRRFGN